MSTHTIITGFSVLDGLMNDTPKGQKYGHRIIEEKETVLTGASFLEMIMSKEPKEKKSFFKCFRRSATR